MTGLRLPRFHKNPRRTYFIRALEGCFITFAAIPKIFLNRQREYVDSDQNKFVVFEIAICSDCGKVAIVGQVKGRKLVQSSKLHDEVCYFYIEDGTDRIDLEEDADAEEEPFGPNDDIYYLCPICGSIYAHNERHNLPCECDSQHVKLRRARMLKNGARCMNCYTGIYKRFYLGNDAATAVLATSLYEELPEVAYVETEVSAQLRTNMFAQATMKERKKAPRKMSRQFLAFSDGRQEAAKFACYLDKSYKEFLRRRGICHVIQENRHEIISEQWTISDFVSRLKNYFASQNTFATNNLNVGNLSTESRKNAWIALLNELARSTTSTSLCSLGQIQFEYVGNTPAVVQSVADNYRITPERAKALLNFLVMEIVRMGAVAPDSDSEIGPEDREYIFYTENQKVVTCLQAPGEKKSTVTGWFPRANPKGGYYQSKRLYYVCKTLNVDESEAARFLEEYFTYLTNPTINPDAHLENINNAGTYVIRANKFRVLINGSPGVHWYKCKRCGRVTFFNIGSCPIVKCGGELEEVDPVSLSQNNHYAKLYHSDRMSPLLVKEHTAQLGKQESAEYQEQFIKKEINALSCSTTFEMGVDVGDLETVFLRDVPPLPSNYAQRAGRAGRSLDAAAFVLTFAKLSSHDFAFFRDPKKMIGGVILPPLFKVDNEKIVRRHIYAVALGLYFSRYPDQYNGNNAGEFINKQGYRHFIDWLRGYPHDLKTMLFKSIPDIGDLHTRLGLENFAWLLEFCGEQGVFTQMMVEYENNVRTFEALIKEFTGQGDLKHARATQARLWHYTSNKLIDFLARGNILPRYGFPVDTVELDQNSNAQNVVSKLRLSRDLQIAIAEYAPSSEIVADGKLYTSRYIKKSPSSQGMDWQMGYIAKCSNQACGTMNYSVTPVGREGVRCSACGQILTVDQFFESIEPRAGFVAEREAKEVPLTHQKKNFRSDDFYIGNQSARRINSYKYLFNDIEVKVESTTNDSLLVKSSTNFYVCPLCGYTLSAEESADGFDKTTRAHIARGDLSLHLSKKHDSLFGPYKCKCQELKRRSLHHEFKTDVAKITFACDTSNWETMLSVMYAILNAMAKDLNIERRDIKACLSLHFSSNREYSIIIYDAVPGGAGHSRRLVTEDGRLLYSILMSALFSLQECNCDPSCYNCLRSYENQKVHDGLNRLAAIDFLSQFAGACGVLDFGI